MPEIDHPHTDPGDGRVECSTCGKWVHLVTHSCKRIPVTARARLRTPAESSAQRPSCHDISVCVPMYGPEGCGSPCCHPRSAR